MLVVGKGAAKGVTHISSLLGGSRNYMSVSRSKESSLGITRSGLEPITAHVSVNGNNPKPFTKP